MYEITLFLSNSIEVKGYTWVCNEIAAHSQVDFCLYRNNRKRICRSKSIGKFTN